MTGKVENLAAVLHGKNDLRIDQWPVPEPKENEVQIRMACVGICGSDVHYYTQGHIGKHVMEKPLILGHEGAGVVTKLGSGVKNLKIGDRVAIEPGIPCRSCKFCKIGRYNLCKTAFYCASPPHHGNLSHYYTHAADFCHKLPDDVSIEEGALLQPLAIGVHACRRAEITLGSTVLILGAGPIGLITLITAKAMGASKVLITDIVAHRLEAAKKFGADFTVQVSGKENEEEQAQKIESLLGEAPDITIDCCGVESSVKLGMQATATGGTFVIVGMGGNNMNLTLGTAVFREVDIRGIFRFCNAYPSALALVKSGKVDVKALITHNFQLKEAKKAFQTAISGEGNPVKIIIHCN